MKREFVLARLIMIITSVIINHQIRRSALYGMGIRVRDVASRAAVTAVGTYIRVTTQRRATMIST